MSDSFDLTDKIAIVTGGSQGLGKALSLGLAKAGADVVVSSRRLEACSDVARQIEDLGRRALPVACDMGKWEEIDRLAEQCFDHFGRCDVLVNNAGVTQPPAPMLSPSPPNTCSPPARQASGGEHPPRLRTKASRGA